MSIWDRRRIAMLAVPVPPRSERACLLLLRLLLRLHRLHRQHHRPHPHHPGAHSREARRRRRGRDGKESNSDRRSLSSRAMGRARTELRSPAATRRDDDRRTRSPFPMHQKHRRRLHAAPSQPLAGALHLNHCRRASPIDRSDQPPRQQRRVHQQQEQQEPLPRRSQMNPMISQVRDCNLIPIVAVVAAAVRVAARTPPANLSPRSRRRKRCADFWLRARLQLRRPHRAGSTKSGASTRRT